MNRLTILLLLGCLFGPRVHADAQDAGQKTFTSIRTNVYHLPAGEFIPHEQWVSAQSITIDGDAGNDLFLFAGAGKMFSKESGMLAVNGSVTGDLWAAGLQKIEINGPVGQHLRAFGPQMIRINSLIEGNVLAATTTASLDTNALVRGSARIYADYFILRGTVEGDLTVRANKVVIDGIVHGSCRIRAGEISILSQTRIDGDLACETLAPVIPDSRAVIGGALTTRPPAMAPQTLSTFIFFIGAILAGMFFFMFSPRLVVRSVLWMETYPWRTLLVGLSAFMLVPFAVVFMAFSWLGIPLGLVIGTLYGLCVYLGRFIAALSLARLLTGARSRHPMPLPAPRLMLLGLSFLYLTSFLPSYFSNAIWFWFTITGMGGLIMASRGTPISSIPFPPPLPLTRKTDSTIP